MRVILLILYNIIQGTEISLCCVKRVFDNQALTSFFQNYGVKTKVERGGRVFPEADDSEAIVKALKKFLDDTGFRVTWIKRLGSNRG
jgi:predicted flavoprotein YhiN